MSVINVGSRDDRSLDTRQANSGANYRSYDSVGLWNNPQVGVRGSRSAFGILPQVEYASQTGFALGFGWDLWSMLVVRDSTKAGSAPKLLARVRYTYGKDGAASDASASMEFESGKVSMPFGIKTPWVSWIGSAAETRLDLNAEIGRDFVSYTSRFGMPTSSWNLSVRDFLNFGEKYFALFKSVGYTLAYNGNWTISDESRRSSSDATLHMYGYRASNSWWGKWEAALNISPKVDFSLYLKQAYGDKCHRANTFTQENRRAGANIGAYLPHNIYVSVSGEVYDAVAQYNGDPYKGPIDGDLSVDIGLGRVAEWNNGKNYFGLKFGAAATEIRTWSDRGFRPPMLLTFGGEGVIGNTILDIAYSHLIKEKRIGSGIHDNTELAPQTEIFDWQSMEENPASGLEQTAKIVHLHPRKLARYWGPAKITLKYTNPPDNHGNRYQGVIYEYNDPATGWRTVDPIDDGMDQDLGGKLSLVAVFTDKYHGRTFRVPAQSTSEGLVFDFPPETYGLVFDVDPADVIFTLETNGIDGRAFPPYSPASRLRINCHFRTEITYR